MYIQRYEEVHKHTHPPTHPRTHTCLSPHLYIYIYIYMRVCREKKFKKALTERKSWGRERTKEGLLTSAVSIVKTDAPEREPCQNI